jgi:hypothetical protein
LAEITLHNDRFPTDPFLILAIALLIAAAIHEAGRLTLEQTQALGALGTVTELALLGARLVCERR